MRTETYSPARYPAQFRIQLRNGKDGTCLSDSRGRRAIAIADRLPPDAFGRACNGRLPWNRTPCLYCPPYCWFILSSSPDWRARRYSCLTWARVLPIDMPDSLVVAGTPPTDPVEDTAGLVAGVAG